MFFVLTKTNFSFGPIIRGQDTNPGKTVNISFTGWSLGGEYAQLVAASTGCVAKTFSAPGMAYVLEDSVLRLFLAAKTGVLLDSDPTLYSNIENYSFMNDPIGNYREHIGNTYLLSPIPIINSLIGNVHSEPDNYNFNNDDIKYILQPDNWDAQKVLALIKYDINFDLLDGVQFIFDLYDAVMANEEDLYDAIEIIETEFGTPLHTLKYQITNGQIILGDAEGGELSGSDPLLGVFGGHDTIYGNEGNDEISGLGGNDLIYGDRYDGKTTLAGATYNDTIDGGSGNDKIYGGAGNDSILGGSGKDYIDGGEGRNTLIGGSGVDTYIANSNDVIIDTDGYGSVSLKTAKPVLQALRSSLISVQSWEKNQKIAA